MMQIFQSLFFVACFLMVITAVAVFSPAQAAERPGYFGSGTLLGDGSETDYSVPPYLNDAVTPNNAQWEMEDWTPSRWIAADAKGIDVVQRFYDTGLITDQDIEDGVPVLEVSDLFVRLSDSDKRRVLMLIDRVYGVTSSSEGRSFYIEHDPTNEVIGVYSSAGMQLQ